MKLGGGGGCCSCCYSVLMLLMLPGCGCEMWARYHAMKMVSDRNSIVIAIKKHHGISSSAIQHARLTFHQETSIPGIELGET